METYKPEFDFDSRKNHISTSPYQMCGAGYLVPMTFQDFFVFSIKGKLSVIS